MAYANSHYAYPTSHSEPLMDGDAPPGFDDDDSAVLDPSILDADLLQSSDDPHLRKPSLTSPTGVLSPAESQGWEQHYSSGLTVDHASNGASMPHITEQRQHQHPHVNSPRHIPYVPQFAHPLPTSQWRYEQGSGHCSPSSNVGMMPTQPPMEGVPYVQHHHYHHHHRADSAHPSFGHPLSAPTQPAPPPPFNAGAHPEAGFIPAPQMPTPMSPHSHQDWMAMAQQEVEQIPTSKRMRPASPPRTSVDFQRRDGIRKKNGRIDIPQERNIQTIDELIDSTIDEDTLKELKQQKRLLRNREAALASRQRKKRHTEDLETKTKDHLNEIHEMTLRVNALEKERQHQIASNQMLYHQLQENQRVLESLQDEKTAMVIKHTEETSNLRRKIQVLMDQLEAGPAPSMSAAPSSTGFTDFNAEMEALNMGPHDWDNFIYINDLQNDTTDGFVFDRQSEPPRPSSTLEKKSSSSTVVPTKKSSDDQPIASGLLFFLLLCGAFVASKPPNSHFAELPDVPDDVRAAAPTVLSNLLAESSGVVPAKAPTSQLAHTIHPSSVPPRHNGLASDRSRLDLIHHRITSPTKQQQIDQAFALTTEQYASMTNLDPPASAPSHVALTRTPHQPRMHPHLPSSTSQQVEVMPQRRNLADALASLQEEHVRTSKASVYTRSLLWDQIPADVVKQFREMVRDHEEIEQGRSCRRQQQQQQHVVGQDDGDQSELFGFEEFKVEA